MSKATKRKHVTREVLEYFFEPDPNQEIAKVLRGKGNNFHDVVTASGKEFVASMPTKFRRNVWIKRGDYVVLDPIEEGNKVKGEIACILYPEQIEHLKKNGLWPEVFACKKEEVSERTSPQLNRLPGRSSDGDDDANNCDDDEDDDLSDHDASLEQILGPNPNRPPILPSESQDEDSDEGSLSED